MRQFTQRELISEGFWDGFKRVAKGAAFVGKHVLPKTAAGISKVKEYGKGFANAISSKETLVKKELERQGYTMVPGTLKQHGKGKNFIVFAKPASEATEKKDAQGNPIMDPKTGEPQYDIKPGAAKPFIVDEKNQVKPISNVSKVPQQQGNQPPPLPPQGGNQPPAGTPPPLPPQGQGGTPPPAPTSTPPVQTPNTPPAPAPTQAPTQAQVVNQPLNSPPTRTPVPKKGTPRSRNRP